MKKKNSHPGFSKQKYVVLLISLFPTTILLIHFRNSHKAIETRKATHLIGTPTMFTDMVNNKLRLEHDISSLSYAIVGGAPVTPALVKQAEIELDLMMAVGYGKLT